MCTERVVFWNVCIFKKVTLLQLCLIYMLIKYFHYSVIHNFWPYTKKVSTTMIQFGCCKADHHNRQIWFLTKFQAIYSIIIVSPFSGSWPQHLDVRAAWPSLDVLWHRLLSALSLHLCPAWVETMQHNRHTETVNGHNLVHSIMQWTQSWTTRTVLELTYIIMSYNLIMTLYITIIYPQ